MTDWWNGLSALNRTFYVLALFFSTIFVWQFISSFAGLGGEGEGEAGGEIDAGADMGDGDLEAPEDVDLAEDIAGLATFRMLSIRSMLAFGTLFSWAGALYLPRNSSSAWALVLATLWGLAGMLVVALFFWMLPRLSEEGTANLDTAIGRTGQVYLNIPEDGTGQIKVLVSGALKFVRARSKSGQPLLAGTRVHVVRRLATNILEVEEVEI